MSGKYICNKMNESSSITDMSLAILLLVTKVK